MKEGLSTHTLQIVTFDLEMFQVVYFQDICKGIIVIWIEYPFLYELLFS